MKNKEALKLKSKGSDILRRSAPTFTMTLFILMLGCILLLVIFASGVYSQLVNRKEENGAKRACLTYISQRIRAQEEAGAISIIPGPEGDALVIAEISADTGAETRIYLHEGQLVEEYAFSDSEFSPENAQTIAKTARFNVQLENNRLLVATAEGAIYLNLHIEEAVS